MNHRTTMIIASAVAIMMAITAIPLLGSESDAAVGDGRAYSYTLEYDPTLMSSGSAAISLADMNAIYHPSYDGNSTTGYGSWTWDATTGIGPFNSFYGAFDGAHNNAFVGVLDPFNLTHLIDGTDISASMSTYNIMWVLPTVYWSATEGTGGANPTLTLSNDPTDGEAYAHTIDGHTYNYIAIGVYEGRSSNGKLWSVSNLNPTGGLTRANLRTLADSWTMDSSLTVDQSNPAHAMIWNFYQWELYKYVSYVLMEDFNSQNTVGNGHVYGTNSFTRTGETNTLGPYAGNPGVITDDTTADSYGRSSVKLFIENAWGGLAEFVDGVVVDGTSGFWIDTSSVPTDATTASTYVTYIAQTAPLSSFMNEISTNAQTWGLGTHEGGSATVGLCDYYSTSSNSNNHLMTVGGNAYNSPGTAVRYGISNASTIHTIDVTADQIGSRLAFVFDANLTSADPVTSITPSQSVVNTTAPTAVSATVSPSTALFPELKATVTSGSGIISLGEVNTVGTTSSVTVTPIGVGTAVITWSATDGSGVVATQTVNVSGYTVTVTASPVGYGTVSPASLTVPYGASVYADGATLHIGSQTVTATPSAPLDDDNWYRFTAWTGIPNGGTITANTTIGATFDIGPRLYNITWVIDGERTVDQYEYGETPVPPEVPEKEGYIFEEWRPTIKEVTEDATYTAHYTSEIGQSVKPLLTIIPVLVAIGIMLGLAYTFFRTRGGE